MVFFPTGKLPFDLLNEMVSRYGTKDPAVVVPPGTGADAAVIDIGHCYLIVKSDPIIFATDQIGWYVVHINANDIACMGGDPKWFLMTMMFPEGRTDRALAEELFAQVASALEVVGATLIGGHSEVAYGITRPIISGHMLGTVDKDKLCRPANAKPGDRVIIANPFPIEGTALVAREKRQTLLDLGYTSEELDRAAALLFEPGISVVRSARIAKATGPVHSMHDPTEGGVATGLIEMAIGAGAGLRIDHAALPFIELGRRICSDLGLDPMGAFGSGTLLLTVPPESVADHLSGFAEAGIQAAEIGVLTPKAGEYIMVEGGRERPIPHYHRDELMKLF